MTKEIERKLSEYFENRYGKYENEIEWYANPDEYSWKFRIPSLRMDINLVCDDDVREHRSAAADMLDQHFVEKVWDDFGDVPMDPETECIEDDYFIWDAGTDREEIWHWFDAFHPAGVYYLLYERK